jgi:hypothetical protein
MQPTRELRIRAALHEKLQYLELPGRKACRIGASGFIWPAGYAAHPTFAQELYVYGSQTAILRSSLRCTTDRCS